MFIDYENDNNGYLDITIGQKWEYITITRNFIENFLKCNFIDQSKISKIIIAISELLENAVKYSNKNGVRAKVKKILKDHQLELIVYNHVDKVDAEKLIKYIYEIDNIKNPMEFYLNKMKEAVRNRKNGLGLPRVKCESEADLSAHFFEEKNGDGTLGVSAKFKV